MMWQLSTSVGGTHYENISLLENPEDSESKISKRIIGLLEYSTPKASITAKPSIANTTFSDSTRNTTDIGLQLSTNYRTQKIDFQFSTDTQRDSSFTSEETTTGFLDKKIRRKTDQYSPALTVVIDSLSTVSFSHSFTDIDYLNGRNAGLFDYEYKNNSISYNRLTDSLGTIGITVSKLSQDVTQLQSKYDTKIIQVGLSKDYSQTFSYSANIGLRRYSNSIGYADYSVSDKGWIMDLSGSKQFASSRVNLSAKREVSPSGGGYMILRDQIAFDYKYQFSEQLTYSFYATAFKNTRETESEELKRYYGSADFGITYNFAPRWNISFNYQIRKNHSEEMVPGKDNMVKFMLSYSGPKTPVKYYGNNTDF